MDQRTVALRLIRHGCYDRPRWLQTHIFALMYWWVHPPSCSRCTHCSCSHDVLPLSQHSDTVRHTLLPLRSVQSSDTQTGQILSKSILIPTHANVHVLLYSHWANSPVSRVCVCVFATQWMHRIGSWFKLCRCMEMLFVTWGGGLGFKMWSGV